MTTRIRCVAWVVLAALTACVAPVDDRPRAEITLHGSPTGRSVDPEFPAGVIVDVDGRSFAVDTRDGDTPATIARRLAAQMAAAGLDARAAGATVALRGDDGSPATVGCYEVDEGLWSTLSVSRP